MTDMEKHEIDPNDVISKALDKTFHITLNAKLFGETLIFIPEDNTEYCKFMSCFNPFPDDEDERVIGVDEEFVCYWPSPVNAHVRIGSLSHSDFHDRMQFYIMTFSRGYDLEDDLKKHIRRSNPWWKRIIGLGGYRVTVQIVPESEKESHGV